MKDVIEIPQARPRLARLRLALAAIAAVAVAATPALAAAAATGSGSPARQQPAAFEFACAALANFGVCVGPPTVNS